MVIIAIKEFIIKTVPASQIEQNSKLLKDALKDNLLINLNNKPNQQDWMDETFGVMNDAESKELLETIYNERVNKE